MIRYACDKKITYFKMQSIIHMGSALLASGQKLSEILLQQGPVFPEFFMVLQGSETVSVF